MKPGNLAAWASAQLFFVLGVLAAVVFAVTSDEIVNELSLGESDLGALGGVFFVAYAVSQLVLGIAVARVPARLVLAPSALVAAAGTFLFGASHGLATALAARALMGIGLGSTFVGVIYLVGRRYGNSFAFMSSLSQSIANIAAAALAIASAFLPILVGFRMPFEILAVLLAACALLVFLFVDDTPEASGGGMQIAAALRTSISSAQFWAALVFYCGTFGTLLAFADLWNIQFQMNFFDHGVRQSAVMNAMIPLGVTAGSLAAGWWAEKAGAALPSRIFVLLALACFGALFLARLPAGAAGVALFLIGCGFGSSTLGLAIIHQHLPANATPLATSLVVTAACLYGGAIQPLVGSAIAAPHRAAQLLALATASDQGFDAYQQGLLRLTVGVALAAAASFVFRGRKAKAS